jgi:transducin (beta)-like 1
MSPGGRYVATGSGDGWMNIYNVKVTDAIFHARSSLQSTKTHARVWQWFAGLDKPGVFEIDWQLFRGGNFGRIAVALESRKVQVFDTRYIPEIPSE